MKYELKIILLTLLIFGAISCSSQTSDEISEVAENAENIEATPTPEPSETPRPTLTPTPEPTSTATPIPSPTPELCDRGFLESSIASINLLESYQSDSQMFFRSIEDANLMELFNMQLTVELEDAEVKQMHMFMTQNFGEPQSSEMIFTEDLLFFKPSEEEPWQAMEGEFSNAALERLTDSQFIKPELVDNLDFVSCQVSYEMINGVEAKVYSFDTFSFEGITDIRGNSFVEQFETVEGTSLVVSLQPFADLYIPVALEINMQISQGTIAGDFALGQEIFNINQPVVLEIPEVVSPTFPIEIPLDPEAVVVTELDNVIAFTVPSLPEEALKLYKLFFVEEGWIEIDSYTNEEQGIEFMTVEYEKDGAILTLLVGENLGITVVSIGLEEMIEE